MTSPNPRARACSALTGLVVVEIALPAPCARANWVTALPTAPPMAGARTVLPGSKPAWGEGNLGSQIGYGHPAGCRIVDLVRDRAQILAAHGDPLAIGAVLKDPVRSREHHPGAD